MINKKGYTIIEILIVIIILSIILSLTTNVKFLKDSNNLKNLIIDLQIYNKAINTFHIKYGFLPGDLKKTSILKLSLKNTDGNENGLIEDSNQQKKIYNKNLKLNKEVKNFWLHLYNSQLIKDQVEIYPTIDFLKTGILVFSMDEKNYFHLSVSGISKTDEIELVNNFTPYQAYLIDTKIDDGMPITGKLISYYGSEINIKNKNKQNKKCVYKNEYLTIFKEKTCQLIFHF